LRLRRFWESLMNFLILFATLGCITKSARTLDIPSLLLPETFTATVRCTEIFQATPAPLESQTSLNLNLVISELFNAKKERDENSKINENKIFKITGIEYRLSEAEKENNSKSLTIEVLKAENGKEGVPKTLLPVLRNRDYTKEINMLNHEIERLMAEESTKSDAADLQTAIVKKELSDLEIKMKHEV
jgi:uncharacterized small protein (DUF1192 family)